MPICYYLLLFFDYLTEFFIADCDDFVDCAEYADYADYADCAADYTADYTNYADNADPAKYAIMLNVLTMPSVSTILNVLTERKLC